MLRFLVAFSAAFILYGVPKPALAWDYQWCLTHHVYTGECAHWFPPPTPAPRGPTPAPISVTNTNNNSNAANAAANANATANSASNATATANQGQKQGQTQTQGQNQSQTLSNSGNSTNALYGGSQVQGLTNAGNSTVSNSTSTNWQAPLNFINTAGPCDRAAAGLTAGSTGVGVGVTVPLGRRGGECDRHEQIIDQCIRYDQAGYTVDGLDCSRLHRKAVVEAPVPVPAVVTKTRLVVYKEPAGCIEDRTRDADLALIHEHRHEDEYLSPAALAAHDRLVKACVSSRDMLKASDGRDRR